ncbi:hypothetical protein OS493_018965 [Desmophyllum pertusum]|uniref:Fibrinogen C-terminal domain-containing protein n=1 Tax=Desmophyllum pertusum TaxID=174260 RepID=A0A9W9Z2G2_9CNID|nr:hypothetical protein OS493_018965 [Desmophyllum pertusum]
MDTSEKHKKNNEFKSCAEIHQEWPQVESGYYWVKIGNRDAQVYCDMENHGGGWTLAVSISSKNNDHLQREANNCSNSILCVPFTEKNIIARKLSDEDIHKLAQTEGTFRVDMWKTGNKDTAFYQIPSGPEHVDSFMWTRERQSVTFLISIQCPRHHYFLFSFRYQWELTAVQVLDRIGVSTFINGSSLEFLMRHDDKECGNPFWSSSGFNIGKRVLYGYQCNGSHADDSLRIYRNRDGMMLCEVNQFISFMTWKDFMLEVYTSFNCIK